MKHLKEAVKLIFINHFVMIFFFLALPFVKCKIVHRVHILNVTGTAQGWNSTMSTANNDWNLKVPKCNRGKTALLYCYPQEPLQSGS